MNVKCISSNFIYIAKGNGRALLLFNVFVQSIKTTNKSNLSPLCALLSTIYRAYFFNFSFVQFILF